MQAADIDLSDIRPRYRAELAAFHVAARAVARDVFCEHLAPALAAQPLAAFRRATRPFGNRLVDYLIDNGDAVAAGGEDGPVVPAPALAGRTDAATAIAAYADGQPHRASVAYFLTTVREVAGGVLGGGDGFRLARARDPRGLMPKWEQLMLEAPVLEPCRVFAARALAALAAGPRPPVVFEGGAGVGVVLRTLLADDERAPLAERIGTYHFTELDPALLSVGRARLAKVAPAALQRAIQWKTLDLDAFARDPATFDVAPGTVDGVILEHVLYDVADLHATLTALRRLLRKGGALIFTGAFRGRPATFFPCEMLQLTLASYQRARLDPPWRAHLGYLTLDEWERSLDRAGFDLAVDPAPADQERMPHGGVIARPR